MTRRIDAFRSDERYMGTNHEGEITYVNFKEFNHDVSKARLKLLAAEVDVCATEAIPLGTSLVEDLE
jgi:hypothetical protein